MELARPSAAGELFGMSAAVISTLEKTALAIGQMVDVVRSAIASAWIQCA